MEPEVQIRVGQLWRYKYKTAITFDLVIGIHVDDDGAKVVMTYEISKSDSYFDMRDLDTFYKWHEDGSYTLVEDC